MMKWWRPQAVGQSMFGPVQDIRTQPGGPCAYQASPANPGQPAPVHATLTAIPAPAQAPVATGIFGAPGARGTPAHVASGTFGDPATQAAEEATLASAPGAGA